MGGNKADDHMSLKISLPSAAGRGSVLSHASPVPAVGNVLLLGNEGPHREVGLVRCPVLPIDSSSN